MNLKEYCLFNCMWRQAYRKLSHISVSGPSLAEVSTRVNSLPQYDLLMSRHHDEDFRRTPCSTATSTFSKIVIAGKTLGTRKVRATPALAATSGNRLPRCHIVQDIPSPRNNPKVNADHPRKRIRLFPAASRSRVASSSNNSRCGSFASPTKSVFHLCFGFVAWRKSVARS